MRTVKEIRGFPTGIHNIYTDVKYVKFPRSTYEYWDRIQRINPTPIFKVEGYTCVLLDWKFQADSKQRQDDIEKYSYGMAHYIEKKYLDEKGITVTFKYINPGGPRCLVS